VVLIQISSLTCLAERPRQESAHTLVVTEQKIGSRIASAASRCRTPVLWTRDESIAAAILVDQIAAICEIAKIISVEIAFLYPETIARPHRQRVLARE